MWQRSDLLLKTLFGCFILFTGCQAVCYRRRAECIDYEVLSKSADYEERSYPMVTWVTTTIRGPSLSRAMRDMYRLLFRYIQGDNEAGKYINTTFPVRTKVEPCGGSECNSTYTMSFLIPSVLRDNPPFPNNPAVRIVTEPPRIYLARSFDGLATEGIWLQEGAKLLRVVKAEPAIDRSGFYVAWYDPPLRLFNRRNEVWVERKPKKLKKVANKAGKLPK